MRKALAAPIAVGVLGLGALAIPAAAQASTGPTTTTFGVTGGPLTITTPDTASLGTMTAGTDTSVSGSLGTVTVTDDRAPLNGSWTASVISSDFTTGGKTAAETIPAADVTYAPGSVTGTTGTVTPAAGPGGALGGGTALTAFSASAEDGISSVSWNPTITVTPPASAVAGTYTGTITHSVA